MLCYYLFLELTIYSLHTENLAASFTSIKQQIAVTSNMIVSIVAVFAICYYVSRAMTSNKTHVSAVLRGVVVC
jgi:hypothetical protein